MNTQNGDASFDASGLNLLHLGLWSKMTAPQVTLAHTVFSSVSQLKVFLESQQIILMYYVLLCIILM